MFRYKDNETHMQSVLTKSYMLAMLLVLLIITVFFAYFQFTTINRINESNIKQTSAAVGESVDYQIKMMNTVSINALYSNLLRDSFSEYLHLQNDLSKTNEDAYAQNNNAKILHDLMFAIIGANFDVRQLNLYNLDSGGFGTGLYNGFINSDVDSQPWYESTLIKNGYRYIAKPAKKPHLSEMTKISPDTYYISLCRVYFDRFNHPDGIIEVVQYYDTVFEAAKNPDSSYNPNIYIYSDEGMLLYPIISEQTEYFDYFSIYNGQKDVTQLKNTVSNEDEYVYFDKLDSSDFITVTVVDKKSFYAPTYNFIFIMLIGVTLVILLCYIFAKQLTKYLSTPLMDMHNYLSKIDFENFTWQDMDVKESNIVEINELKNGINLFQQKLKSSMDNIILLQQHETQSLMLALQSQMNPHFLYNSLSTIIAMAEEDTTENITEMCVAITGILRYISSNAESLVSLEIELENTDRYISCLKFRYEDRLNFNIDIDDTMLNTQVPKLCTQLLVENAVKFTTTSIAPPWHIDISCTQTDDLWFVTVLDNGQGFPDEVIKKLTREIMKIKDTDMLPNLELDGMGLMNIFIRLRLLYKDDCIFEFGNRRQGGAYVRIGGKKDV